MDKKLGVYQDIRNMAGSHIGGAISTEEQHA